MKFSATESGQMHGFAGYFDTVLYKDVMLSEYKIIENGSVLTESLSKASIQRLTRLECFHGSPSTSLFALVDYPINGNSAIVIIIISQEAIYVPEGSTIEIHIWRKATTAKVCLPFTLLIQHLHIYRSGTSGQSSVLLLLMSTTSTAAHTTLASNRATSYKNAMQLRSNGCLWHSFMRQSQRGNDMV